MDPHPLEPNAHRGDIEAFLRRLSAPSGHFLEVRCISPDVVGATPLFCSSVTEVISVAQEQSGHANVYVGACPRAERSGRRSSVALVTAAWADIDFHQVDPHDRQRAETLAHERLHSLGRRPTILVHSGNGLQAWWVFAEPIPFSQDWPAERFEAINRGLARALGGDAVHDLARVLRVPGTLNVPDGKKRARGCVPVMAKLLWADGPTYSPGDLDGLAVPAAHEATRPTERRDRVTDAKPSHPDTEVLDAFGHLLDELGPRHPLVRVWHGDRVLADTSRSGWDMALVNQLFRTGIREPFIPQIVRGYRHGRGVFASDDYIERTMAKARSWVRGRHGSQDTA